MPMPTAPSWPIRPVWHPTPRPWWSGCVRCWRRPCRSRRPGPRDWAHWAGPRASPAWLWCCWTAVSPSRKPDRRQGPRGRPDPRRRARPEDVSTLGGDQVEGRRAVLELLSVGRRPVRRILLAEDQDPSPQLDRIEELAARMRIPVETVPRARLDAQARTEHPGRAGPGCSGRAGAPRGPLRADPGHRTLRIGGGRHHRPAQPGRPAAQRGVRRGHRRGPAPAPLGPPVTHGGQDGGRRPRAPALCRRGRHPRRPGHHARTRGVVHRPGRRGGPVALRASARCRPGGAGRGQ